MSQDGSLVCFVEELLDVSLDVAGEEPPAVALERRSIGPDEELLEVPGHVVPAHRAPDDGLRIAHQRGRLVAGERETLPQEDEQGMSILPVHVHLLQELKPRCKAVPRTDILQRQEDFFVPAVLLNEATIKVCLVNDAAHVTTKLKRVTFRKQMFKRQ